MWNQRRPLGRWAAGLALLAVTSGCGRLIRDNLKAPVADRCAEAQLRRCDQLNEGVLLFATGNRVEGRRLVLAGASSNTAADVRRYALLLGALQSSPSALTYADRLDQAVKTLLADGSKAALPIASDESAQPDRIRTADTDLDQAREGSLPAPTTSPDWCSANFGGSASCVMATRGQLFLTDLTSVGKDCEGQFAAVLRGGMVRARFDGPFELRGARLLLRGSDTLVFGQTTAPPPAPTTLPPTSTEQPAAAATTIPTAAAVPLPPSTTPAPIAASPVALADEEPSWNCGFYWSGFVPYRVIE